jgi:tetratricopeptide (TPR) repeat protein
VPSLPAQDPAASAAGAGLRRAHGLTLALVFLAIALLALRTVDSLDVGFHLEAGEHVLSGRGWPRSDPFTYTLEEQRYVDTSWGYQVLIALLQRAGGAPALVLLHAGFVLATFALLWCTARLQATDPTLLVLFFLLGALASEQRFAVRPELLSYLLLAGLLYLLQRHAAGLRAPLRLLPFLFLLWANMHALFVLGWAALACFVAGLALAGRLERALFGWSLACVPVALVNPYGLEGVRFPFTLLTRFQADNPFRQEIGEFVSPLDFTALDGQAFYPWVPVWAFRMLLVLAALALVGLVRRRRWWCGALLVVFAWPALAMVRNLPLLVVAGLPVLGWGLSRARPPAWPVVRALFLSALSLLALVLGLRVRSDAYYVDMRRAERTGLGWNEAVLPIEALAYVRSAGIEGRPINHLNLGGWLMWAQEEPVFIDGRLEVVGEEFYRLYRRALASQEALEECVARWGIRWAIFPYANFPQLLGRMSADQRWRLAHVDPVAAVFVRAGPDAARFVDPALPAADPGGPLDLDALPGFAHGPARPGALAHFAQGLWRRARFPTRDHQLGLFHLYRGELEASAVRFAAAIASGGGRYYEHYSNLGAVLFRLRRLEQAAACYRIVLDQRPHDALVRSRLAEIARLGAR